VKSLSEIIEKGGGIEGGSSERIRRRYKSAQNRTVGDGNMYAGGSNTVFAKGSLAGKELGGGDKYEDG